MGAGAVFKSGRADIRNGSNLPLKNSTVNSYAVGHTLASHPDAAPKRREKMRCRSLSRSSVFHVCDV